MRLARLGAVKAGGLLTLLLTPTPTFGELTLVQFEGANGADIEFRHQPGESQATLSAVGADGIEFRFFLVQSGGGFIVRAAQRTDGLGGLVDLSASQAMVIAGDLFGQWNEGFTTPDLGIDLTTTIFPLPEQQGPLIFITQATDPRPFILSTPIADPLPTAVITTPPDVGWMDLWQVNTLPTNPSQLRHIFRDDPGHLSDTPENRRALSDLVNNPENRMGVDRFGNEVYVGQGPDGRQVWGFVRNGVLQNGGVNDEPWEYQDGFGLRRP